MRILVGLNSNNNYFSLLSDDNHWLRRKADEYARSIVVPISKIPCCTLEKCARYATSRDFSPHIARRGMIFRYSCSTYRSELRFLFFSHSISFCISIVFQGRLQWVRHHKDEDFSVSLFLRCSWFCNRSRDIWVCRRLSRSSKKIRFHCVRFNFVYEVPENSMACSTCLWSKRNWLCCPKWSI